MVEWQPPTGNSWFNVSDVLNVKSFLDMNYNDLINKAEFALFPLYSIDGIDDLGDWIERWIRKRLRT